MMPIFSSTEAGHPVVGLFSSRLETYGGTMGQLVFPCVLAVSFWRKGGAPRFCRRSASGSSRTGSTSPATWLTPRQLELPLLGGGVDHDWNTILTRWDLLQYDTRIAAALRLIAWIGIATTCAWALWRAWEDRGGSLVQPD